MYKTFSWLQAQPVCPRMKPLWEILLHYIVILKLENCDTFFASHCLDWEVWACSCQTFLLGAVVINAVASLTWMLYSDKHTLSLLLTDFYFFFSCSSQNYLWQFFIFSCICSSLYFVLNSRNTGSSSQSVFYCLKNNLILACIPFWNWTVLQKIRMNVFIAFAHIGYLAGLLVINQQRNRWCWWSLHGCSEGGYSKLSL